MGSEEWDRVFGCWEEPFLRGLLLCGLVPVTKLRVTHDTPE